MSLVFTVVNSTADKKKLTFLAPGAVRSIEELVNYKPYHEFVKELPKDCSIETTLAVYEYGEGEKFTATFEELAYLTIRMNNGVDFLHDHCKALGNPIMPEEDTSKYFMVSLLIQQLYREILVVADDNGGKLKNRVVFYCDEFGTLPKIESAEMMFSASRSRRVSIVPISLANIHSICRLHIEMQINKLKTRQG